MNPDVVEALLFAAGLLGLFAIALAVVIYLVIKGAHPNVLLAERLGKALHARQQKAILRAGASSAASAADPPSEASSD
jgi:hypothetical protein